jgi:hypothetical protein
MIIGPPLKFHDGRDNLPPSPGPTYTAQAPTFVAHTPKPATPAPT